MTFASFTFLVFLCSVVPLYWALGTPRRQNAFLVAASYVFYGWWDARFCVLIFASSLVDYGVGIAMDSVRARERRKILLVVSVVVNLGLLSVFKYFNFFATSLAELAGTLGWHLQPLELRVILPVGISFYTFQTLSYTIDVYRGRLQPTRNLIDYLAFVSFFPQLVAGPIERGTRLLPQIRETRVFNQAAAVAGCRQILWGLFAKVVIADQLGAIVDSTYEASAPQPGTAYLIATVLFAFQIYFDFSAYSNIAIGTARILGIELMRNFAYPYFSQSVGEFWRRWHISLSTWFRDYVYVPLGGNRGTGIRRSWNVLVTFLVSGLWHGASWNFVVWGGLHGVALLPSHLLGKRARRTAQDVPGGTTFLPTPLVALRIAGTFAFVCATWIFFRANDLSQAWMILGQIGASLLDPQSLSALWDAAPVLSGVLCAVFVEWLTRRHSHPLVMRGPRPVRWVLYTALVWIIIAAVPERSQQFVYFQF